MAREHHDDGSYTDRFDDGSSYTYGENGDLRESVKDESSNPISIIPFFGDVCEKDLQVTRDSDGNVTKAEWIKK